MFFEVNSSPLASYTTNLKDIGYLVRLEADGEKMVE
jgi:hypothetical protein